MADALQQRIDFIKAIDALKEVQRKTYLLTESRFENSAEHSWAVATMALTFASYAPEDTNINRVIYMLLLHDIVEVDAGDALLYDDAARAAKAIQEKEAATRLFGLLPEEQGREFRAIWDEFEAEESQEAQFAAALDRFIPMLHNLETEGRAWRENHVSYQQVIDKNQKIEKASPELWEYMHTRIKVAVNRGWLAP
ncbi:putative hydrolases of HD superfamily [Rubritalea squalenifaciens DSM 18772]|uniref:5'-deoxynucleotidase n=1 Tax=Rubritalea squalenifaciens DSM 18772 TaxID=1123071 RepID=A0A1M6EKQ3_9BACT|nr:HD domain-containing protein [Rubritalea squalenifaciens]SHI86092.1 putative hydrolases of HD superfamily [Rubritalea squalenifaciens DSM 18772]